MSTQAPRRQVIDSTEFFLALMRVLYLRGFDKFYPGHNRWDGINEFHLSMHQAYEWLASHYKDQDGVLVAFRFSPHKLHGFSPAVSEEVATLFDLRLAHVRRRGDGAVCLDMDPVSLERSLAGCVIPRDLLDELAERFMAEYRLPRQERSWPDGYTWLGQSF